MMPGWVSVRRHSSIRPFIGSTVVEDCSPAIRIGTLTQAECAWKPFSSAVMVMRAACSPVS